MQRPVASLWLHRTAIITFFFNHLSPHASCLRPPSFFILYPIRTLSLWLSGRGFETSSYISSLGCLVKKLSLWGKLCCPNVLACCAPDKMTRLVIFALYIVLVLMFAGGGELRVFLLFDLDPWFYSHVSMLNNN